MTISYNLYDIHSIYAFNSIELLLKYNKYYLQLLIMYITYMILLYFNNNSIELNAYIECIICSNNYSYYFSLLYFFWF